MYCLSTGIFLNKTNKQKKKHKKNKQEKHWSGKLTLVVVEVGYGGDNKNVSECYQSLTAH